MKQYKVGDKVKVRADLVVGKRYGADTVVSNMMDMRGKVTRITKVFDKDEYAKYKVKDGGNWNYTAEMFDEILKQEIHITVDDNKTIAVLKEDGKVVKRAEAKRSPEDTFNFETGAKLAFARLFETVKEVNRTANAGEYIKIVDANKGEPYANGDIFKVKEMAYDCDVKVYCDGRGNTGGCGYHYIDREEYVVLENYDPSKKEEKKPEEPTTFKVVCAEYKRDERYFTIGKIYTWENNTLVCDDGFKYDSMVNGADPDKWRLSDYYKFIKIKEDK